MPHVSSASHSLVGLAIQRSDYAGFFRRVEQLEPALEGRGGRAHRLSRDERERFQRTMHTPPLLELWALQLPASGPTRFSFGYLADDGGYPIPGMPPDAERRYFTWALACPTPGRSWEVFGQLGGLCAEPARRAICEAMAAVCEERLEVSRCGHTAWNEFMARRAQRERGHWLSVPAEVLTSLDAGVPPPFGHRSSCSARSELELSGTADAALGVRRGSPQQQQRP